MPTMVEVDQYKSALTPQQVDTALKKIADNDIADFMTQTQADARYLQKTALLNLVYPVGSIYMSANATSPASFLGGSWERIQGRFLLAASSSYTAGSTGGEATHTLTESEIAAHVHDDILAGGQRLSRGNGSYGSSTSSSGYGPWWGGGFSAAYYAQTSSAGGGQPHNNMPPYLAVYIWKRTA